MMTLSGSFKRAAANEVRSAMDGAAGTGGVASTDAAPGTDGAAALRRGSACGPDRCPRRRRRRTGPTPFPLGRIPTVGQIMPGPHNHCRAVGCHSVAQCTKRPERPLSTPSLGIAPASGRMASCRPLTHRFAPRPFRTGGATWASSQPLSPVTWRLAAPSAVQRWPRVHTLPRRLPWDMASHGMVAPGSDAVRPTGVAECRDPHRGRTEGRACGDPGRSDVRRASSSGASI